MITSDTNFRGNFDSIEAVWEAIPYGGVEGDYLNIQGVKYRWNKYLAMWENAEVVTETPARETVTFDEDVNMQNDLTVAGVLRAKKFVVDDLPTGIEDVEITESAVSGGNNVITFTYTNGESQTFNIKNGEAGKTMGAFGYASSTASQSTWNTAKNYLVPTATEGEFDVYTYEDGAWYQVDTFQVDIAGSADAVEYDDTTTQLNADNVQEAIEALNDKTYPIDDALDETSEHPVQNKVVTDAVRVLVDTGYNPYCEEKSPIPTGVATVTVSEHGFTGAVETPQSSANIAGITCVSALLKNGKTYKVEFEYSAEYASMITFRDTNKGIVGTLGSFSSGEGSVSNVLTLSGDVAFIAFLFPANTAGTLTVSNFHIYEVSTASDAIEKALNRTELWVEYTDFCHGAGFLTPSSWYGVTLHTHTHKYINVKEGMKRVRVTANPTASSYISFFKSYTTASVNTCTGSKTREFIAAGTTEEYEIPSDCGCIIVDCKGDTVNYEPASVSIKYAIKNRVDDINVALIKQTDFASDFEKKTITPSAEETCIGYYTSSWEDSFTEGNSRLLYFPELYVKGGEEISFTATANIIAVELPYIPLGVSAYNCVSNNNIVFANKYNISTETTINLILHEDTKRIAFIVADTIETTEGNISQYITSVTLPVVKYPNKFDLRSYIDRTYPKLKDYNSILRQATFTNGGRNALKLLHFTDPHGDLNAFSNIVDIWKKYNTYITDMMCTGDVVYAVYDSTSTTDSSHGASATHGYKAWVDSPAASKSLFVLGNHDCATIGNTEYDVKEGGIAWNGKGKDWAYTTYFAPFAEGLGIVQPDGVDDPSSPNYHACYWHKDYAAEKVRLIGLDCMNHYDGLLDENNQPISGSWVKHGTAEQEDWLRERLAETLNSEDAAYGYSIVIICHFPLNAFKGNRNETWNDVAHKWEYNHNTNGGYLMNAKTSSPTVFNNFGEAPETIVYSAEKRANLNNRVANPRSTYGYDKGNENYTGDIIKNFMDNGGKFVAWICGHTHIDSIVFCPDYPDIVNVIADNIGITKPHGEANKNNYPECVNSNIYVIDTERGLFKIIRIGVNLNLYFDQKNILCYDYINRRIINEG